MPRETREEERHWKRWSRQWMYESLGLFKGYRVRRPILKVAPAR